MGQEGTSPRINKQDRFERLWPAIKADLTGVQDVICHLSPTTAVKHRLSNSIVESESYPLGPVIREVLKRIPGAAEHFVVVPWLGMNGGSETVTSRILCLLREHYKHRRVCVLAPDDGFRRPEGYDGAANLPLVAINDIAPQLSFTSRLEIFDRVMIEVRPKVVHTINSFTGWKAFCKYGRYYSRDCRLYGNLYSDFRSAEGSPDAYYFWQTLPQAMDWMAGLMVDNSRVIQRAKECFGFLPPQLDRFYLVPTPILGVSPAGSVGELGGYSGGRPRRTLWMSRISEEKRLDVLYAVATRCPDRTFAVYGSSFGAPVDLSELKTLPNIEVHGAFQSLTDIPVERFDSYLFTTSAEGMPCSILEVSALGLPIIAPDVGGIGEFVDEETGWLISRSDAVEEYVQALGHIESQPETAAARVKQAQQRLLQRHTWEHYRQAVSRIPGYLGVER